MEKNYFGLTDTGKVRDNNEDTFIAESIAGTNLIIACVIDGVGGYSGGEIASGIARKTILEGLSRPHGELFTLMKTAIIAADAQIMQEKQRVKDYESMACVLTLAVIDLDRNQFHYAHVGDTRLYLMRDHSLVKISKDQSFVGFMEDSGRLTEEQAMKHPKRNEINKALGFGAQIASQEDYIEFGSSPFLPADQLLICSDGLSDMVNKQEISSILLKDDSLEQKSASLIQAANRNGGLDNITVVLVKNNNAPLLHEATKPQLKSDNKKTSKVPLRENPVAVKQENAPAQPVIKEIRHEQKSNKGIVRFLVLICLGLLALCIYLFWRNTEQQGKLTQQPLNADNTPRNAQEIRLQDTLNNLKGNILIISDSLFTSPILLTEELVFNRDTLFIKSKKELVIRADSTFKGNAIVVKPAGKYIFLENLTFENFSTAISAHNNELVLKNVQFRDCANAISSDYPFPQGKFINGKISRNTFKTDSIPTP